MGFNGHSQIISLDLIIYSYIYICNETMIRGIWMCLKMGWALNGKLNRDYNLGFYCKASDFLGYPIAR